MKKGQFGKQGKEFFETFPNGAISCENIVVQCNSCGRLMVVPELTGKVVPVLRNGVDEIYVMDYASYQETISEF